jgi:hypothetical protein
MPLQSRQATLMPQICPPRQGQAEPRSARSPSSFTSVSIATLLTCRRSGSSEGGRQLFWSAPGEVMRAGRSCRSRDSSRREFSRRAASVLLLGKRSYSHQNHFPEARRHQRRALASHAPSRSSAAGPRRSFWAWRTSWLFEAIKKAPYLWNGHFFARCR